MKPIKSPARADRTRVTVEKLVGRRDASSIYATVPSHRAVALRDSVLAELPEDRSHTPTAHQAVTAIAVFGLGSEL